MCLILLNLSTWLGVGLGAAIAITFAILWSCSKEEVTSNVSYEHRVDILTLKESNFLSLLNEYRRSHNLTVLEPDALAGLEAYKHNVYMIEDGQPSHNNYPNRQKVLIDNGALKVGEIIGYGYSGIQGAYMAFLASEEHLSIIKGDYNAVGVDIMAGDKDFYTIIFIKI